MGISGVKVPFRSSGHWSHYSMTKAPVDGPHDYWILIKQSVDHSDGHRESSLSIFGFSRIWWRVWGGSKGWKLCKLIQLGQYLRQNLFWNLQPRLVYAGRRSFYRSGSSGILTKGKVSSGCSLVGAHMDLGSVWRLQRSDWASRSRWSLHQRGMSKFASLLLRPSLKAWLKSSVLFRESEKE